MGKVGGIVYEESSTNHLILLRTFFTYKMKEGTSLKAHLNIFDDLLMKMKAVDLKIEEEKKAMILLCSLPDRYAGFSNSLIYSRDTLTLDDVKTGLLRKKLRDQMKELGDGSSGASSDHGLFVEKERYMKKENRGHSKSRKPR